MLEGARHMVGASLRRLGIYFCRVHYVERTIRGRLPEVRPLVDIRVTVASTYDLDRIRR